MENVTRALFNISLENVSFSGEPNTVTTYSEQSESSENTTAGINPRGGELTESTWLFATSVLDTYFLPAIIVSGVIGNILVIILMRGSQTSAYSVRIFYTGLACANTGVLIFDHVDRFVKNLGVDIYTLTDVGCRLCTYLLHASLMTSIFTILAIAIERVLVVCFPLKANIFTNFCRATVTMVSVVVISAAFNLVHIFGLGIVTGPAGPRCSPLPAYSHFFRVFKTWITPIMYSYIPVPMLVVSNIIIICRMTTAAATRNLMTKHSANAADGTLRFTLSAMSLCTLYIVCTIPNVVFFSLAYWRDWFRNMTPELIFTRSAVELVGSVCFAGNLLVYIFSSKTLMKKMKDLLTTPCCREELTTASAYADGRGSASTAPSII